VWFLALHPQEHPGFDGGAAVRAGRGERAVNEGGSLTGQLLGWEVPLAGGGQCGEGAPSSTSHLGLGVRKLPVPKLLGACRELAEPLAALAGDAEPHGPACSLLRLRLGLLATNSLAVAA